MPTSSSDYHLIVMNDDDDGLVEDCGYSRPILVLNVIWNLSIVMVSVFLLVSTTGERSSAPLRLWVCGYALQCLLQVAFVWVEFQWMISFHDLQSHGFSLFALCHTSIIKNLESINTVVSLLWWVFGFYWIVMGGQTLLQDSPHLYWLSVIFLAFDMFFVIFSFTMALTLFMPLFCCAPILATVAYAMKLGEGASEHDIMALPKYTYCQSNNASDDIPKITHTEKTTLEEGLSMPTLSLNPDDSECCICLNRYGEGAEVCRLPCKHHFDHGCICRWLRINATCPLCKFNILKNETLV